jgi:protein phosphatase
MRSAGRSETGKVRTNNEDNYQILDTGKSCVMVLADGIGGVCGGEIASKIAVDTVLDEIRSEERFDTLAEEELKKFHPSLEVEEATDAIYNQDMTDMADLLVNLIKEERAGSRPQETL